MTVTLDDSSSPDIAQLTGTVLGTTKPAKPKISNFSPAFGSPGTVVTIDGTNLEDATSVTFNGVVATMIKKDTETKIKVEVPAGAKTGRIEVTTGGGLATSKTKFKLT